MRGCVYVFSGDKKFSVTMMLMHTANRIPYDEGPRPGKMHPVFCVFGSKNARFMLIRIYIFHVQG